VQSRDGKRIFMHLLSYGSEITFSGDVVVIISAKVNVVNIGGD